MFCAHPLPKSPLLKQGMVYKSRPSEFYKLPKGPSRKLPKGPSRSKKHYGIVNYYAVVFLLRPPDLLRREPLSEGTNVCNSQENCVRTPCAAIVKSLYAIVNLLRRANLLRRSLFSTAGSFGCSSTTK